LREAHFISIGGFILVFVLTLGKGQRRVCSLFVFYISFLLTALTLALVLDQLRLGVVQKKGSFV
jgi:hypothetical protein